MNFSNKMQTCSGLTILIVRSCIARFQSDLPIYGHEGSPYKESDLCVSDVLDRDKNKVTDQPSVPVENGIRLA